MNPLFADTSFFVAFLGDKDEHHELAVEYMDAYPGRILTTLWVLAELGNYLSNGQTRRLFAPFVKRLRQERRVRILPLDEALFGQAIDLYGRRLDKDWSVTDCISFVTMRKEGVMEALTADHHFEQAQFRILLK